MFYYISIYVITVIESCIAYASHNLIITNDKFINNDVI